MFLHLKNRTHSWLFPALFFLFSGFLMKSWNLETINIKWEHLLIFIFPFIFYVIIFDLPKAKSLIVCIFALLISYLWTELLKIQKISIPMLINKIYPMQENITNWIKTKHTSENAEIINLFVFNYRINSETYYSIKKFGITFLVVISGFHVNFLKKTIIKILKKLKIFGKTTLLITNLTLLFYWWCLNFACIRAFLQWVFSDKNWFVAWSKILIFTCFFDFDAFTGIPFVLSFGIAMLLYLTNKCNYIKIEDFLTKNFLAFVFANLILLPAIEKIYYLQFINMIIFMPIILFTYLFLLMFAWFSFLSPIHEMIFKLFKYMNQRMIFNKAHFAIIGFTHIYLFIFLSIFILLIMIKIYSFQKNKTT